METFIEAFKNIWRLDIKERFENGFITWEHQLQAHLYHFLKSKLNNNYEIWIEPVLYLKLYGLDKVRPDLIITNKEKKIIAIVELKVNTWGEPFFKDDIEKLNRFKKVPKNIDIVLGFIPFSNNWDVQKDMEDNKIKFTIDEHLLTILAIIAKPNSEAFTKNIEGINIFKGFVDNGGKADFE